MLLPFQMSHKTCNGCRFATSPIVARNGCGFVSWLLKRTFYLFKPKIWKCETFFRFKFLKYYKYLEKVLVEGICL